MLRATLLALAVVSGATAAEVGWRDDKGNPLPDTEYQKSVAGFGGLLLTTPDADWQKKWNTPGPAPQFSSASTVARGGKLFILTMFTNPQMDDSGVARVTMDIDVKRPDGSSSSHAEDAVCFEGKIPGPPQNVYLCGPLVDFIGEPADPAGTWSVQITLHDKLRKVSVPLATRFELLRDGTTPQR